LYSGVRAGRELSLMGAITGVAPIVAPVIGGGLQTFFGWRASFVLLLVFAAVVGLTTVQLLPETLREPVKTPFFSAHDGRDVPFGRGASRLSCLSGDFDSGLCWLIRLDVRRAGGDANRDLWPHAIYLRCELRARFRRLRLGHFHRGPHRHAARPRSADRHRHGGDGLRRPCHGGGRRTRAATRAVVCLRDDPLSPPGLPRAARDPCRRAHPASRSRPHRLLRPLPPSTKPRPP